MKITITYLPEEEREANCIRWFIHGLFPGTKVYWRHSKKDPNTSMVLQTKEPEILREEAEV